jgi:hypothetical protein
MMLIESVAATRSVVDTVYQSTAPPEELADNERMPDSS